jgi:hypothetical protein
VPRRSFFVVNSANQRSTRFSHGALVGVKCSTKRGCAVSQRFTAGVLTIRILEKTGQLAAAGDPDDINERGRRWYSHWVNTWRDRYWGAFNVNHQIDERELLYANPSSEPATFNEIRNADGSYKRLDSSDLYKPFAAAPRTDGDPPAGNEDVILAMLAAP